MAGLIKGYYHCLECGALFEAVLKDPKDQRCPICGNPPTGKILAGAGLEGFPEMEVPEVSSGVSLKPRVSSKLHGVNHDTQQIYEATMATMDAQKESRQGRVKRTKRKGHGGSKRWLFVAAWLVLMLVIVVAVRMSGEGSEEDDQQGAQRIEDARRAQELELQKRQRLVEAALPECRNVMQGFLQAATTAARSQYVYQGVKLTGEMNRYYQDVLGFSSSQSRVRIIDAKLLDGFAETVIGVLFKNDREEVWEAVLIETSQGWKLDWKFLVRYDELSWSLFAASDDGAEGEFRLYMRVRDVDEDFEQKEMSLVFYKPTMYVKDEFRGMASVPVSVLIDSDMGRAIQGLLDAEDLTSGEVLRDAFGMPIGRIDPARYHRVRVKMRYHRENKGGKGYRLELLEILDHHWYGIRPLEASAAPEESGASEESERAESEQDADEAEEV
ncbi:hypothetical protein HW115_10755 [Verrucomicrobiaceae bacterium N1E253]|uniref:Zinc ribbon domain-containing protein n=1 Tax=Oceaniferula marina TaxID=2748318 RepID=A0A851GMN8_9BACT|nr:hypothetical protein [Oceaniferula marina]NWK56090.1 hypothetical protein [Oceaniferula marina]